MKVQLEKARTGASKLNSTSRGLVTKVGNNLGILLICVA